MARLVRKNLVLAQEEADLLSRLAADLECSEAAAIRHGLTLLDQVRAEQRRASQQIAEQAHAIYMKLADRWPEERLDAAEYAIEPPDDAGRVAIAVEVDGERVRIFEAGDELMAAKHEGGRAEFFSIAADGELVSRGGAPIGGASLN